MSNLKFAETHNLVAFLEKPEESDGFEGIIDFLNASSIRYALTVNPTIYTSCIKQFWATAKAKTINGEVQIQALVDGKKVIVTETSVRRALQLKDAEGTECLPNATIFAELERMGYENLTQKLTFYKAFFSPQWKFLIHTILQCLSAKTTAWNEFSSTMASAIILFLDKQVEGMTKHKEIYVTPSHTKKVFANMKREGKGFSGRVTPLFQTMMVQAQEEGEGSEMPTVPQHTSTINQPSSSQPPKKQKPRKTKKQNTEVSQPSDPTQPMADETENVESVPIHSNDPLLSGEDRLKLNELLELCTKLSERVLDLENTKTSQAAEITKLKERVKKLERRNKSRTPGLKRLRKVGRSAQVVSSDDEVFDKQEVEVEKVVSTAEVTTASATTTTVDELTLAQTLIEIKAAKPKAVTTAATTTTTTVTRSKAGGVIAKDKGKGKMVESEKPLKRKDQILVDEEIAQRLQEELQAELEEEERLARQKEEEDNLISWDNTQAMMEADYKLAQRLQAEEQGELTIKEKSKLFLELMNKRKKHFAKLRAEEIKRKPPTKAQKRNQMCTYLKNMANYKHIEVDDEAEMKKLMEIVPDDEVAIDAIPLAIKSPIIVDWKIIKEGKWDTFKSTKLMEVQGAKHGNTRPEEAYERVLWGDLKVMFEPDVENLFVYENMEEVSSPKVAAAKLPVLNPGEFELWKIRIEQYFLMTDYALWEVKVNGDSPPPNRIVNGVEKTYPPTTAEEKLARKNELKAR
ncbi:hypothetical protein Tco_1011159, partial [Tanacetum coccineum]